MISVIVPYRDSELWLGRCCESMHEQGGDFEFILVNDWSEDGGPKIVDCYVDIDSRFRGIVNQRGKGVSGARNTGLDAARGEWVTFLDADDELLPNAYRTLSSYAEAGRNVIQFNHIRYYTRIDKLTLIITQTKWQQWSSIGLITRTVCLGPRRCRTSLSSSGHTRTFCYDRTVRLSGLRSVMRWQCCGTNLPKR